MGRLIHLLSGVVCITIPSSTAFQRIAPSRTTPFLKTPTAFSRNPTFLHQSSSSSSSSETTATVESDVLILGSGPSARAIASLLSNNKSPFKVIVADANYDREWAPNYGVWEDEWQAITDMYNSYTSNAINVDKCINRKWNVTDCFFGGSFDIPDEFRFGIDRAYLRVDKVELANTLGANDGYTVIRGNHVVQSCMAPNLYSPMGSMVHDEHGSIVKLSDGSVVRCKLVIDCTGHESKLTLKEQRVTDDPGFQIAYGAMVTVKEEDEGSDRIGPYRKEAMTLFDYRTDHFPKQSPSLQSANADPTFMYVMPIQKNQIFFEETSLVARPGISFQLCKDRCLTRLSHLGIEIEHIEEEEYCYIPMGGALPAKDQRVIGLGGASATVHPSTGYHLCRMMTSAVQVAKAIETELSSSPTHNFNPDRAAASAYDAIWSPENIRQRNFAVFGGEFLMKQNVEGLRGFFDGFFRLPQEMWAGFLAGWPGLPNNTSHETWNARLWFGVLFLTKLPLKVALDLALSIGLYCVKEGVPLPQSVSPFLGKPEGYGYVERDGGVGDEVVKKEARDMIAASRVTEEVPVAFNEEESSLSDNAGEEKVVPLDQTEKVPAP